MSLILDVLFLLIAIVAYFVGGFISSMALSELKTAKKYVPVLVSVLTSILAGVILMIYIKSIFVIIISLALFLLFTFYKKINAFHFLILLFPFTIILNNFLLLQIGIVTFLFEGIVDYKKNNAKKKIILKVSEIFLVGIIVIFVFSIV